MPDDVKLEKRDTERHELLFGVRRSVRYHSHRRRFFDSLGKFIKIFTVIGGVGTITTLLGRAPAIWTLVYAAAAGLFSTIDLVIGCAGSAKLHSDLAREFIQLERQMTKAGANLSDEQLGDFVCRRLEIEEKEPTILRVLDLVCHNELCRAMGYERCAEVKLSWGQRFFAQFFDVGLSKIEMERGLKEGVPSCKI